MKTQVLNYRIIVEKEKYGDGSPVYVAYAPSLGISDYGDTVEDALDSIKDGIKLAVEVMAEEGQEIPVDNVEEQLITSAKIAIPSSIKIPVV